MRKKCDICGANVKAKFSEAHAAAHAENEPGVHRVGQNGAAIRCGSCGTDTPIPAWAVVPMRCPSWGKVW